MIAMRSVGWLNARPGCALVGILLATGCVQPSLYRADDVAWSLYNGADLMNGAEIALPAARQNVQPVDPAHFTGCKPDDTGGALCVWQGLRWGGGPSEATNLIMVLDRRPSGKYFVRDALVSPPGPSFDQLLANENMPAAADSALVRFLLYAQDGNTDSALGTLHAAVRLGAAPVAISREALDQAANWLGDGLVGEPYDIKFGRFPQWGRWPASGSFTTDADSARVAQQYLAIAKTALDSAVVPSYYGRLNALAAASWYILAEASADAPATAASCEQLSRAVAELGNAATAFQLVPTRGDTEAMRAMRRTWLSETERVRAMAAEACRRV